VDSGPTKVFTKDKEGLGGSLLRRKHTLSVKNFKSKIKRLSSMGGLN
jgi:hypothetical protein